MARWGVDERWVMTYEDTKYKQRPKQQFTGCIHTNTKLLADDEERRRHTTNGIVCKEGECTHSAEGDMFLPLWPSKGVVGIELIRSWNEYESTVSVGAGVQPYSSLGGVEFVESVESDHSGSLKWQILWWFN